MFVVYVDDGIIVDKDMKNVDQVIKDLKEAGYDIEHKFQRTQVKSYKDSRTQHLTIKNGITDQSLGNSIFLRNQQYLIFHMQFISALDFCQIQRQNIQK